MRWGKLETAVKWGGVNNKVYENSHIFFTKI